MKYEHKNMAVWSKSSNSQEWFNELLISLDEGWEIVSTVSDDYTLHYILRRPKKGKK